MEILDSYDLHWSGPFKWPGVTSEDLPDFLSEQEIAKCCGVYLWTVEHESGYLIYAAGITRRPFGQRFREHTRAYRSGVYTVFDVPSFKSGIRKKVWQGFWFKKRSPEAQNEYQARADEIRTAAEELLQNYRVFLAPLPPNPRVLQRIEAAIMNTLYLASGPASVIPDRGMALAPRWPNETPIRVRSLSSALMHGLPCEFEA